MCTLSVCELSQEGQQLADHAVLFVPLASCNYTPLDHYFVVSNTELNPVCWLHDVKS